MSCRARHKGARHAAARTRLPHACSRARAPPNCCDTPFPERSCCFHGCSRHARIREYNAFVKGEVGGLFQTCVTTGNAHEINPRDRVVIGSLLDKLRIAGNLSAADVEQLPFNSLREW